MPPSRPSGRWEPKHDRAPNRMSIASRYQHRVQSLWVALTSSLWFIPGAMVMVALVGAVALVELSTGIDNEVLDRLPRLFGAGADGSRDMLSTIAGSVITVAGVTFSITIAALAQSSAQYTPRVLRTFMADRANQVVLGTFVGVYAYCLVVLRTIRGGDEGAFVPSLAVLVGFLLALVSVGVLIFFIHHIASALQASTILERVRRATEAAVRDLFPDEVGEAVDEDSDSLADEEAEMVLDWRPVEARRTGYIQNVDADGLLELAREHGVIIRMDRAVGDFVMTGAPIAHLSAPRGPLQQHPESQGEIAQSLDALYTISAHRTVEQDAAFGLLQISDIALKALSPGINDTTTAVTCVDHIGALLAGLAKRQVMPRLRRDGSELRVIALGPTFAGLVSLGIDDIRRNAEGNVTVLGRLLDALESVSGFTRNPGRRRVLAAQVDLLGEAVERSVRAPSDREALAARVHAMRNCLTPPPVPRSAPDTLRGTLR